MAEIVAVQPAPLSTKDIVDRIKDLRHRAKLSNAEMAKLNIQLGAMFAKLKVTAAGSWENRLDKLGYKPRVASRLMKIANLLADQDGAVDERLLVRLPGDPIKLETLCQLDRDAIKDLVKKDDCQALDRQEIAAMVRKRLGKSSEKTPSTEAKAIIDGWANAVKGMLKRVSSIQDGTEKQNVTVSVVSTLDDVRETLEGGDQAQDPVEDSGEAAQESADDDLDHSDLDSGEDSQTGEEAAESEKPETHEEEPEPALATSAGKSNRSVGKQKAAKG